MYRRPNLPLQGPPFFLQGIINNVQQSVQAALSNLPQPQYQPNLPHMEWQSAASGSSGSSATASGRPPIPSWGSFPRDDEIKVDVISHPIKDNFTLKRSVSVSTVSGAIKADITPSPTPSTALFRKLNVASTSGAVNCSLTTSLGPFLLDSSHSTISGAIKLSYPSDWCGTVEIFMMTGSHKVTSDLEDVRIVNDVVDRSTGERKILALKGNPVEGGEFSTMKVRSKTGAIQIRFEKKPALRDMTAEEIRADEEERNILEGTRSSTAGNESASSASEIGSPSTRGFGPSISKGAKEMRGPAVYRASSTEIPPPPPLHSESQASSSSSSPHAQRGPVQHGQPQHGQPQQVQDLPPSYEQSEAENVMTQVAGRD